jgi:hypothetical protein
MFDFNQKSEVPLKNLKTSRGPCLSQALSILTSTLVEIYLMRQSL